MAVLNIDELYKYDGSNYWQYQFAINTICEHTRKQNLIKMKFFIVFAAIVVIAIAAPLDSDADAKTIHQSLDIEANGEYDSKYVLFPIPTLAWLPIAK